MPVCGRLNVALLHLAPIPGNLAFNRRLIGGSLNLHEQAQNSGTFTPALSMW